jgi:hypothetical protein
MPILVKNKINVSYTKLGIGCTYVSVSPFVKTKYASYTKLGSAGSMKQA